MSFAGKGMELEINLLSETNQTQRINIPCFLSYVESRPKKKRTLTQETCRRWEGGKRLKGEYVQSIFHAHVKNT
jgi:hypothetical protein